MKVLRGTLTFVLGMIVGIILFVVAIGGTVVTLNIRAKTGASVVSVMRDGHLHRNIGPEWEFHIGDTLGVLGEGAQIAALKDLLGVVD